MLSALKHDLWFDSCDTWPHSFALTRISPSGFALLSEMMGGFAVRSRVLARLASLAQIGELARRLYISFLVDLELSAICS